MKKLVRITTVPISLHKLLGHQLEFMNRHFQVIAISADEKKLESIAAKYGVDYHHIEMTRQVTLWPDLKALWHLYRFLKKEKPAIVHTHTPKAGIVGMLASKFAGVPHRLHTVAGMPLMETTGMKRKVLDFVEKLTYKSATRVYPNSRGLYDFIVKNEYTTDDKLKVIANGSSNGIDTNHFSTVAIGTEQKIQLRTELNISTNDFVFVFVGRLTGHKGVSELVNAFKQLRERRNIVSSPDEDSGKAPQPIASQKVKLLLVGPAEPDLDPILPGTLEEIETNHDILSVGYQQDVRPYFAISNALAFPSYREGFPNAVLQAGAMGLPSIVTDINGCNEIIIEGENGTIIPVKNTEALQNAMERLITDNEWRERLEENARPMITSRYEQQVVWDALLEEYRSLN